MYLLPAFFTLPAADKVTSIWKAPWPQPGRGHQGHSSAVAGGQTGRQGRQGWRVQRATRPSKAKRGAKQWLGACQGTTPGPMPGWRVRARVFACMRVARHMHTRHTRVGAGNDGTRMHPMGSVSRVTRARANGFLYLPCTRRRVTCLPACLHCKLANPKADYVFDGYMRHPLMASNSLQDVGFP